MCLSLSLALDLAASEGHADTPKDSLFAHIKISTFIAGTHSTDASKR